MTDVPAIVRRLLEGAGIEVGSLSSIGMNRSQSGETALALLAFPHGIPRPVAFVKVTSAPSRARALEAERANLATLTACGGPRLRDSVPRPLALERVGDLTFLVVSAEPGVRMKNLAPDRYFRSARFERDFTAVIDWLAALRETSAGRCWDARETGARAEREVRRYLERHDASPALRDLLDRSVAGLAGVTLRPVPWHGDFCTANVLLPERGGVFVVDWEYPLADGWPLADLLHFVSSTWCVPYRKGPEAHVSNYRRMFFGAHRFSERLAAELRGHAEAAGAAASLVLPLAVMSWLAYANRKAEETAGLDETAARAHTPLILIEAGRCLNLEILAELQDRFLPAVRS